MMAKSVANSSKFAPLCPPGHAKIRNNGKLQANNSVVKFAITQPNLVKGSLTISRGRRSECKVGKCAASINARCAAEQTQTIDRPSSTISISPLQAKQTPKLDDGGTGLPPREGDGGGGGGGGGGSKSSGGFFLFGFLLFLSYLRDQEEEATYQSDRRY